MDDLIPLLVVVGPVSALAWFMHRRSAAGADHPLWPAFNATAGAAILILAGTTGYNLNMPDAARDGTSVGEHRAAGGNSGLASLWSQSPSTTGARAFVSSLRLG